MIERTRRCGSPGRAPEVLGGVQRGRRGRRWKRQHGGLEGTYTVEWDDTRPALFLQHTLLAVHMEVSNFTTSFGRREYVAVIPLSVWIAWMEEKLQESALSFGVSTTGSLQAWS